MLAPKPETQALSPATFPKSSKKKTKLIKKSRTAIRPTTLSVSLKTLLRSKNLPPAILEALEYSDWSLKGIFQAIEGVSSPDGARQQEGELGCLETESEEHKPDIGI